MPLPRQSFSRWCILSIIGCFVVVTVTCTTYFVLDSKHHYSVDWITIASPRGDKFPDFSFCGYHNSEIILPTNNTSVVTVPLGNSSSDDVTLEIQKAIDSIASSGGGSVVLPSGRWPITAGIYLRSNVVVTGSDNETILVLQERPSKPVFTLGPPSNAAKPKYGFRSNITNDYIPIGSSVIGVVNNTGLVVHQLVYVCREATESWIRYNGMGDLVRDSVSQTWIPVCCTPLL